MSFMEILNCFRIFILLLAEAYNININKILIIIIIILKNEPYFIEMDNNNKIS